MSISCGLSNLNVHGGDKVGFLILGKNVDSANQSPVPSSFGHTTDLYKPFLPPVFGTLDNNRDVKDLDESVTLDALRVLFQRPVAEVLRCIASEDSIYSSFSAISSHYLAANPKWNHYDNSRPDAFKMLGFEVLDITPNAEYYSFADYTVICNIDSVSNELYPVRTWSVIASETGKTIVEPFISQELYPVLDKLGEATGLYPGFDSADYQRIALLNNLSGMIFLRDVYEQMRDYLEENDPSVRKEYFDTNWASGIEFLDNEDVSNEGMIGAMLLTHLRTTCVPANLSVLKLYKNPEDIYPAHGVTEIAGMVNRMLMPSMWGNRFSENEAFQHMNKVTDKILAKRQAEYERAQEEYGE